MNLRYDEMRFIDLAGLTFGFLRTLLMSRAPPPFKKMSISAGFTCTAHPTLQPQSKHIGENAQKTTRSQYRTCATGLLQPQDNIACTDLCLLKPKS